MVATIFILAFLASTHGLQLKRVIMLSRHNVRTPFTRNLQLYTPEKWQIWNNGGDLTPKGRVLERAMGKYLYDWMVYEDLFEGGTEVFVYSNTVERALETAKEFVEVFGAQVKVYHENISQWDPVFNAVIRNNSENFKEIVLNEMESKLKCTDLDESYLELERIVDFRNSLYCDSRKSCKMIEMKTNFGLEVNKPPMISGALWVAKSFVDTFLMTYYDGMPLEDVAWGQIKTTAQWEKLIKILNMCNEVRFKTKTAASDQALTLLEYMSNIFVNGTKNLSLLVGHDANILSLMSSLNFKDYNLPGQFEKTPIGGKVVFQKWYDAEKDQDLLRVQYVYQTSEQIREGAEASLHNPPQWVLLEMENCTVDQNGFCLWNDFLHKIIR